MRAAANDELKSYAVPVMTARLSESDFAQLFPVEFYRIDDPEAAREPSLGALLRLDAGQYFVAYYGRTSHELSVRIPTTDDASQFMRAFFREVPLPASSILWHREGIRIPSRPTAAEPQKHDAPEQAKIRKVR